MICVETESIIIIIIHAGEENLEDCDADKVETVVTDVLPSIVWMWEFQLPLLKV